MENIVNLIESNMNVDIYEHYRNHFDRKAVCFITDNQLVLYSQIEFDGYIHSRIASQLEQMIYPDKKCNYLYEEDKDIYIASVRNMVVIYLPKNGNFTKNQHDMLIKFLSELNRVYKDNPKNTFRLFVINNYENDDVISNDFKTIVKFIDEKYELNGDNPYIHDYNEVIIGHTVDELLHVNKRKRK